MSTDELKRRLMNLGHMVTGDYNNRFSVFTPDDMISFYTKKIEGKNVPGVVVFDFGKDWKSFFDGVYKEEEQMIQ